MSALTDGVAGSADDQAPRRFGTQAARQRRRDGEGSSPPTGHGGPRFARDVFEDCLNMVTGWLPTTAPPRRVPHPKECPNRGTSISVYLLRLRTASQKKKSLRHHGTWAPLLTKAIFYESILIKSWGHGCFLRAGRTKTNHDASLSCDVTLCRRTRHTWTSSLYRERYVMSECLVSIEAAGLIFSAL